MLKRITAAVGLGLVVLACANDGRSDAKGAAEANESREIESLVAAYEMVRHQLANDKAEGLTAAFDQLKTAAAEAAGQSASVAVAQDLKTLSEAAERGAEVADSDLQGARKAFAEASSHLVGAISAEPRLAHGLLVFECPMVEHYPKWVQASEPKANPYMGKEMQTCGVASAWVD